MVAFVPLIEWSVHTDYNSIFVSSFKELIITYKILKDINYFNYSQMKRNILVRLFQTYQQ